MTTTSTIDRLTAIADAVEYLRLNGPHFVEETRGGSFNAIAATDLKAAADRLSRNIGAVALALATQDASA